MDFLKKLGHGSLTNKNKTLKEIIREWLDSLVTNVVLSALTLFYLLGSYIRYWASTKATDQFWYIMYIICISIFTLELGITFLVDDSYRFGLFFWFDIISIISIVPEIEWIIMPLEDAFGYIRDDHSVDAIPGYDISHSQVGEDITRVLNGFRITRLMRLIKLYKFCTKSKEKDNEEQANAMGEENNPIYLGKKLIEIISLKIVIGILIVYIIFPFLHYTETDHFVTEMQKIIFSFGSSSKFHLPHLSNEAWNSILYDFLQDKNETKYHILWLHTPNPLENGKIEDITQVSDKDPYGVEGTWVQSGNCSGSLLHDHGNCELRYSEMILYQFDYPLDKSGNEAYSYVRVNIRRIKQEQAKKSFILVCVTIGLLLLASINVGNDTERIMTQPISKMVNMIKKLADDPLKTASLLVKDSEADTIEKVTMLDRVVVKIGKIIELGYGTFGTKVLGENMSSGNGTLNVMTNGKKINLIILVVRVDNFAKIASHLQGEAIMFINKVGSLIAECSETWDGYLNMLDTSSFIVTWNLPSADEIEINRKQEIAEDSSIRASQALIASIKIFAEFRRSRAIKAYLRSSKLKSFVKEFNINISLNFGWGIEGALGFSSRAEAIYISPYIQESIELGKVSGKLRIPIIMTSSFYFLLTNKIKSLITALGLLKWTNFTPFQALYTFEINDAVIEVFSEDEKEPKLGELRPKEKYENSNIDMKEANSQTLDIIYEIDADIEEMKSHNSALNTQFRDALSALYEKNWSKAADIFKQLPAHWSIAKMYRDYINKHKRPDDEWDGSIDIRALI